MSNTLHHVSHHLLGGWLSPGREYGALPWIGRWIQVQGGQTCFLTSLPWNPLVQHAQKTNVTKKKSETWSDMNLIPELVTHAQVATRSDSKLLRNFWYSPDWKMGVHTNAPRNIGKWTDIWTNIVMTYSWNTEMFKLQRFFSAMGTTSGILRNLSPTRVATRSVKSRFLNVGITAGLSHSSAKHHPLILQFHEVQRFELFVLQELQLVWHCRWMHWPSGTAKLGSALIRARWGGGNWASTFLWAGVQVNHLIAACKLPSWFMRLNFAFKGCPRLHCTFVRLLCRFIQVTVRFVVGCNINRVSKTKTWCIWKITVSIIITIQGCCKGPWKPATPCSVRQKSPKPHLQQQLLKHTQRTAQAITRIHQSWAHCRSMTSKHKAVLPGQSSFWAPG